MDPVVWLIAHDPAFADVRERMAALVRQFAGEIEHIENTDRHRERQWERWRRRQARKQNRRRN